MKFFVQYEYLSTCQKLFNSEHSLKSNNQTIINN